MITDQQALEIARKRELVRVIPGNIYSGKIGKINELLGSRWYGRGASRAVIEVNGCDEELIVVPLSKLEVAK
jgi:hypothetical protein